MIRMRHTAGLFLALTMIGSTALGGTRSGGTYSITEETMDIGGLQASSALYSSDASLGGIGGTSSNTSPDVVLKSGYPGQLAEVTNVIVRAEPSSMNEGTAGQLASTAGLDDGTVSALTSGDVQWMSPAFPLASITPAGAIMSDVVYANTAGAVTGTYFGMAGSVALVVIDTHPDNFWSYAGDTIPDAWQVAYFGVENSDALAYADPDEDYRDNLNEYVSGTDPDDGLSYFRLWNQRVEGVSTQVDILYYPRLENRTYVVERSASVMDVAWSSSFDYEQSVNSATCTVRDLNIATTSMHHRVSISRAPTNCGFFVSVPLPTIATQRGYSVTLADFNKDGTLDAFVGNSGPAQVLFTTHNGFYPDITDSGQRLGTSTVYGVASGDLNGDSNVDVFTASPDGGRIWYNNGAGIFTGSTRVVTNTYCTSVAIGDLNGDGYNDLFVCRGSSASGFRNLVLTNNGSGVFGVVDQSAFILDRSYAVALGDLDNDGDLDAYVGNSLANRCYRNDGHANFSLWGTDSRVDDTRGVAIADVNGDGYRDVVAANAWPGPSVVYLNRTNGVMEPFLLDTDLSDDWSVAVADLDGDLRPDIATAGWGDNTVWFNVDGTNFSRTLQPMGSDWGQSVAAGNMNGEAGTDLVIINYDTTNTLWLNECLP